MTAPQVIDHPLIHCHLTRLRDKTTSSSEFRQSVKRLAMLLAHSATAQLPTKDVEVVTPLETVTGKELNDRIGLVPILRAGIGMVEPMLDLIPTSEVWHLGLYRDEATAKPVHYYSKLPPASPVDIAFVLDPMLATGGSACMAVQALKEWGVTNIKMLCIMAAPEGVEKLRSEHPNVEVHTCVIDRCLNDDHYICPGLGDAGDRIFNTGA